MKKVRLFALLALLLSIISSCSDIIEKSIAKDTVTLIAPGNNISSSIYDQTFYWNEVNGALTYELQLASPNFDSIITFVDTTITTLRFNYTLSPGQWQWQVRALNGSSQTNYTTYNLTIIQSSLSKQTEALSEPGNNSYTNNPSTLQLQWQAISGATSYILLIDSASTTVLDTTVSNTQYNLSTLNLKDGIYSWNVTASNDSAKSITSNTWDFTILTSIPDTAHLKRISPLTATVSSSPVELSWQYTGTNANIVGHYVLSVTLNGNSVSGFPQNVTTTTFSLPVTANSGNNVYVWGILVVDKAGNASPTKSWTFKF
jgi:hypothetical protein